jgi:hypothetical protein
LARRRISALERGFPQKSSSTVCSFALFMLPP